MIPGTDPNLLKNIVICNYSKIVSLNYNKKTRYRFKWCSGCGINTLIFRFITIGENTYPRVLFLKTLTKKYLNIFYNRRGIYFRHKFFDNL